MSEIISKIEGEMYEKYPLAMEYETDARDVYPKRQSFLLEQIAALKAERNGYLNGQQQMQDTCSSLQDSIAKYAGERKVLKAEVKRLRELVDCLEFDIGNKY